MLRAAHPSKCARCGAGADFPESNTILSDRRCRSVRRTGRDWPRRVIRANFKRFTAKGVLRFQTKRCGATEELTSPITLRRRGVWQRWRRRRWSSLSMLSRLRPTPGPPSPHIVPTKWAEKNSRQNGDVFICTRQYHGAVVLCIKPTSSLPVLRIPIWHHKISTMNINGETCEARCAAGLDTVMPAQLQEYLAHLPP